MLEQSLHGDWAPDVFPVYFAWKSFPNYQFIKAFSYTFHEYSENPPEGKTTEIRLSIVQKLDLCMKQSVLAMKMMYTSIITVNVKPGLRSSTKIFQAKATEEWN